MNKINKKTIEDMEIIEDMVKDGNFNTVDIGRVVELPTFTVKEYTTIESDGVFDISYNIVYKDGDYHRWITLVNNRIDGHFKEIDSRADALREIQKEVQDDILYLITSDYNNEIAEAILNMGYLSSYEAYAYIENIVKDEKEYFTKASKSFRDDCLGVEDNFYDDYKDVEKKVKVKIKEMSIEISKRIVSLIED